MKALVILLFPLICFAGEVPVKEVAVDWPVREEAWALALAEQLAGESNVTVPHGRVDVLTEVYAIEVDRLPSLSCAIGQAIHYRYETGRQGVVAIVQDRDFTKRDLAKIDHFQQVCASVDLQLWIIKPISTE